MVWTLASESRKFPYLLQMWNFWLIFKIPTKDTSSAFIQLSRWYSNSVVYLKSKRNIARYLHIANWRWVLRATHNLNINLQLRKFSLSRLVATDFYPRFISMGTGGRANTMQLMNLGLLPVELRPGLNINCWFSNLWVVDRKLKGTVIFTFKFWLSSLWTLK